MLLYMRWWWCAVKLSSYPCVEGNLACWDLTRRGREDRSRGHWGRTGLTHVLQDGIQALWGRRGWRCVGGTDRLHNLLLCQDLHLLCFKVLCGVWEDRQTAVQTVLVNLMTRETSQPPVCQSRLDFIGSWLYFVGRRRAKCGWSAMSLEPGRLAGYVLYTMHTCPFHNTHTPTTKQSYRVSLNLNTTISLYSSYPQQVHTYSSIQCTNKATPVCTE